MSNNEGTPLHGDRSVWNNIDEDAEHARDVSDGTLKRHLPLPGAAGGYARSDGTNWQRVSELILADLASWARGHFIRGGAGDWEAYDASPNLQFLVGDGTDIVSRVIANGDLPDPAAFRTAPSTLTIVTGAVTATQNLHTIAAEAGITDDLDTISSCVARQFLLITADTGDTITVKHGTGNIHFDNESDFELAGNSWLLLFYDGTHVVVIGAGSTAALDDLSDVGIPAPNDGDVLTWDSNTNLWVAAVTSGTASLNSIGDVSIPAPNDGDVLTWDDNTHVWLSAMSTIPASAGVVVGPAEATDIALARFDGITGKLLQNSLVSVSDLGKTTFPDHAQEPPWNVTERAAAPAAPATGDIYLDDGANTASTNPGWRRYTGAAWEDVSAGAGGGGAGDVVGPAGATDNAVARYDAATGKLLQDSLVTISDLGKTTFPDDAQEPPLNVTERAAAPGTPTAGDIYLDDGTNTASALPGLRRWTGAAWENISAVTGAGGGDVVGPAEATDNAIARYNTATGKLVQDSLPTVSDLGKLTIPDHANEPPLNVTERAVAPTAPVAGDIYLDTGANTASGNPGWRRYTGAAWEDITAGAGGGGGADILEVQVFL